MSCAHLRVRGNVLQCELKTLNLLHEPTSGRTVQLKLTGCDQGVCFLAQALVSWTWSFRRWCLPGPPSPLGPVTTSFPPAAHTLVPEGILNRATQQTGSLRPPLADPGPQGWDVGGAAAWTAAGQPLRRSDSELTGTHLKGEPVHKGLVPVFPAAAGRTPKGNTPGSANR